MSDKPEYTLKQSLGSYKYPTHMKHPEGFLGTNFFEKWIPEWQTHLGHLSGKSNVVGIELGTLYGDCAVFCAEQIANGENSRHITIDTNETEYVKNNLAPYKNIVFIKNKSCDALLDLRNENRSGNWADYIYIDGSHLAIDVLSDAVLSWGLLKEGGILIFDDYGWGIHTTDVKQKPKTAIDAFLAAYQGHYQIILAGWQVFLKKLTYTYSKEELETNYQQ